MCKSFILLHADVMLVPMKEKQNMPKIVVCRAHLAGNGRNYMCKKHARIKHQRQGESKPPVNYIQPSV